MKLRFLVSQTLVIAVVCLVTGTGMASAPHNDPSHRSSLRARVTFTDGSARTITLRGVGCAENICSRVRAKDVTGQDLWLDGLASVGDISHKSEGPVTAVFRFKNRVERRASVIEWHRVLYVEGRFGRTEKLDLARLTQIDFE